MSSKSTKSEAENVESKEAVEGLEQQSLFISIYDRQSFHTTLKINRNIQAKDVCHVIASKMDVARHEMQYFTLVLVVTALDPLRKSIVHCVRTLQQQEPIIDIMDAFIVVVMERYNVSDVMKLRNAARWFYKDVRTSPMELGETGEMVGECDSDDEEEISHSDLAYLTKADRKGYLLKRSSRDQNLWKKWYCILTDHLWCINVSNAQSKAICIKLSGIVRHKDGMTASEQLQNIIINSPRKIHLFRTFTVAEQKKWIEELNLKTNFGSDNEAFQMAEVIISDEEDTRVQRFQSSLRALLDMPYVYNNIMADHRKYKYLSMNLSKMLALEEAPSSKSKSKSRHKDKDRDSDELTLDSDSASSSSSSSTSEEALEEAGMVPRVSSFIKLAAAVDRPLVHPLDPSRQTPIAHRLHGYNPWLAGIFRYVSDVAHYREQFRHELYVSAARRRQRALSIFSMHILPQLQLALALDGKADEEVATGAPWGLRLETMQRIQAVLHPQEQASTSSSKKEAAARAAKAPAASTSNGNGTSMGSMLWPFSFTSTPAPSPTIAPGAASAARIEHNKVLREQQTDSEGQPHAELFDATVQQLLDHLAQLHIA